MTAFDALWAVLAAYPLGSAAWAVSDVEMVLELEGSVGIDALVEPSEPDRWRIHEADRIRVVASEFEISLVWEVVECIGEDPTDVGPIFEATRRPGPGERKQIADALAEWERGV